MAAVPVLALLAEINGVQQVGAGAGDLLAADGAEIGDRQGLFRWLGQKEIPDRGAGGRGEALKRLQRRLDAPPLPFIEPAEPCSEGGRIAPGTINRPPDKLGFDGHPHHSAYTGSFDKMSTRARVRRQPVRRIEATSTLKFNVAQQTTHPP